MKTIDETCVNEERAIDVVFPSTVTIPAIQWTPRVSTAQSQDNQGENAWMLVKSQSQDDETPFHSLTQARRTPECATRPDEWPESALMSCQGQ